MGIGGCYFSCVIVVSVIFFWISCHLSLFDKQRHLAGNFRGVSGRLCWIFKFLSGFLSQYLLVSCFSVAYCRAILFLRTGRNLFGEYSFLEFSVLFLLVDL